jgi:hypothetical protein
MNPTIHFEHGDGYACFRAAGDVTFNLAVAMIADAIGQAADQGIERLLVDTTNLRGFPHPTTSERYYMADQWASAVRSRGLRVTFVARQEMIDPLRFGVMVARQKGLFCNVFASEKEAIAWLLHPDPE